jgi:hypothetical protein
VDTGNTLNAAVVDFRSGDSQTAKITVAPDNAASGGDVSGARRRLTVTAYTVSGEQSSISIPIE